MTSNNNKQTKFSITYSFDTINFSLSDNHCQIENIEISESCNFTNQTYF